MLQHLVPSKKCKEHSTCICKLLIIFHCVAIKICFELFTLHTITFILICIVTTKNWSKSHNVMWGRVITRVKYSTQRAVADLLMEGATCLLPHLGDPVNVWTFLHLTFWVLYFESTPTVVPGCRSSSSPPPNPLILLQTSPILNNSASYCVHQNSCLGPTQFQF
jgi:hypothetical protein